MKNKFGIFLTFGVVLVLAGAGCAKNNTPVSDTSIQPVVTETQPVTEVKPDPATATKPITEIKPPVNNTGSLVKPGGDTTVVDTGRSKLTVAEVAKHNVPEDCYIIVNSSVYDVTKFTFQHPGGSDKIIPLCGKDATGPFTQQHGGQPKPENVLAGLMIGALVK